MSAHVVALLTSHNRRPRTLACLDSLDRQRTRTSAHVGAVLVDADSSDGTRKAVAEHHPWVTVVRTDPDVFWNEGMRLAWERAERDGPDHYLWLNDDVVLDEHAVATLVGCERDLRDQLWRPAVVIGTTRDPSTGRPTYGGRYRPRRVSPLGFRLVEPADHPRRVETMNGNCVLVPADVASQIGKLDPVFTHRMGDLDYGLRVNDAGLTTWITAGTIGTCATNPDEERTVTEEIDRLRGPKGLPPREWATFCRRWAGRLWPLYFSSPYVRRVASRIWSRPVPDQGPTD